MTTAFGDTGQPNPLCPFLPRLHHRRIPYVQVWQETPWARLALRCALVPPCTLDLTSAAGGWCVCVCHYRVYVSQLRAGGAVAGRQAAERPSREAPKC